MLNNNVVLITGGTGDIGTAVAKQLDSTFKHVIALDLVTDDEGEAWLHDLKEQGYKNIDFRHMDVTDYEQCAEVIGLIVEEFGGVDVLINNAGITRDAVFTKMSKRQWDEVLRVNLDGMFNVTKQVVESMKAQESGRIVNVSSVNAQKGQFSQANYAASKAGVYGFTKSLAQELMIKNITVNSISPGYVNTRLMKGIRPDILEGIINLIPAKRLAEPQEIAWAIEFLISEKSRYITGANLSVNGGLHMY
ncbi:3-oxoacyl-ACP reductase [Legionella pneumophila]|uniref:Acetoacetyl-CoA reductase n=1 Tax=Legionella pneumophila subsp. pascullei TaxID=91890 RepID=A0AAX2IVS5_LEGPN|nr:3-oxoacyl-ACP reductase [Legionella pneumophila]AMP88700.1 beta-ketoacyl-ACP reductase [Legionella pneumophila subsp. pascullei]AMP91609.1 beta-ketoacyl-ACP reductase [Legionella pneumophila subsp. pascullei]AMP94595.1 beta-ketoacyl-ACP reductase [Legionella pneumophila subsp. pascullei]SQG89403.1 acetoacetyl-CoA reductase [Legionella pneumophila subsp. pascullei]VEH04641.1 acetoacetyl-CoA reductase [Legionella pneumophila subsp. pascullei]